MTFKTLCWLGTFLFLLGMGATAAVCFAEGFDTADLKQAKALLEGIL
jgi:hypothetical protein